MSSKALTYVVWQEGQHHVARCLNVEVSSFGESKTEAISNLEEALSLYFEGDTAEQFIQVEKPEIVSVAFADA